MLHILSFKSQPSRTRSPIFGAGLELRMASGSEVSDKGVTETGPTSLAPRMFDAGVKKSDGVVKYGRRSECKSSSHLREDEQAAA